MSQLIEERKARMKALRPADSSPTSDPDSNVVPFTAKASPGSSAQVAADPVGARQQLDAITANTDPENQTAAQKAAKFVQNCASQFEPFRDENDNFYILQNGEAVGLSSQHAADIIYSTGVKGGKNLSKDSVGQIQTVLRQIARELPVRKVHRRIGKDGDAYLIDLGDKDRRCVRVDAHGITVVKSDAVFSRDRGYGELPEPVIPNDAAQAWGFIQPLLVGIPKHDQMPLIAAKVEHLRSDSPQPILIFIGPEGSGKTTIARHCMMAIDPFVGEMPSVAHTERAIYAAAQGCHSLGLDNISATFKGAIEDILCRSSSGGTIIVFELFTTADSRKLRVFVAWHITGIANHIHQADTLDRGLMIRVERPSTYRPDDEIRAEYETARGRILGALVFFLRERIRRAPGIRATQKIQHRMIDFLLTGEALAQAIGQGAGSFIAAVESKRASAAREWVEGDTFASALVKSLAELVKTTTPAAAIGKWAVWSKAPGYSVFQHNGRVYVAATADAICREVAYRQQVPHGLPDRSVSLPSTARATTGAINRVQAQMTRAGWTVKHKQVNGNQNTIWIFEVPP